MYYTQNQKLEQVTEKTLVIGVDIGSESHHARAFNYRGIEYSRKDFQFSNDASGFEAFQGWMQSYVLMFGAKKVAEVTGLALHKVYELMRNRQHFPSMKIGKRYYVSEAALREWIMLHTTENGIEIDG